jgi:hypothetical protein
MKKLLIALFASTMFICSGFTNKSAAKPFLTVTCHIKIYYHIGQVHYIDHMYVPVNDAAGCAAALADVKEALGIH